MPKVGDKRTKAAATKKSPAKGKKAKGKAKGKAKRAKK
jgi:hypothetical protein